MQLSEPQVCVSKGVTHLLDIINLLDVIYIVLHEVRDCYRPIGVINGPVVLRMGTEKDAGDALASATLEFR